METSDFYKNLYQVTTLLTAAISNTRLYSDRHPQVAMYIQKAFKGIADLLTIKPELTLIVIDDELVAENRRLSAEGPHAAKFADILKQKAVERLSFISGLSIDDLKILTRDLAATVETPIRSTDCIKVGKVEGPDDEGGDNNGATGEGTPKEQLKAMQQLRDAKLDEFKNIYTDMQNYKKVDARAIEAIIREFIRNFSRDINPLKLLAVVKSSDEYTFTHVVNVCILTMSLAESIGFTGDHLHRIGIAASLHDTGKLFIPEAILNKPGKLTDEEMKIVQQHPFKGAQYLLGLKGIPRLAVVCSLEHHIRYDGSGYPVINGDFRPHIVSQMLAIADAFDAMRSKRVYQGPKPVAVIMKILKKEKAVAFNPHLVDNFLRLINRF